jgi:hypothetical protein
MVCKLCGVCYLLGDEEPMKMFLIKKLDDIIRMEASLHYREMDNKNTTVDTPFLPFYGESCLTFLSHFTFCRFVLIHNNLN